MEDQNLWILSRDIYGKIVHATSIAQTQSLIVRTTEEEKATKIGGKTTHIGTQQKRFLENEYTEGDIRC